MLHLTAGVVDLTRGRVERHEGSASPLTTTERALLAYLAAHPGRDLPRGELLAEVWGYSPTANTRTLDTAIKVLRRKIEVDPRRPDHVLTVWGVGYRFEPLAPAVDADLIGRAGELAVLRRWLNEGERLVTLVGPGGVGKTRLALELIRARADAVFVDLAAARTAEDLTQAAALSLPDADRRPLLARLADRPRWVVLDNVEQLLTPIRSVVSGWLDHAPGLQLVLTSREGTGDPRERPLQVDPLPLAAATALLRRRTAEARRDRVVEDDPLLEQVAAAMDGLPLAIELAASRAAVLGMEEILSRGPRLVNDPAGTERHGSVLAAVRWSLDLLDDEARAVLRGCAWFRGPFVAADVQAVMGDRDVVAPLERALRASLISRHRDGRSLQLLPLVRFAVHDPASPGSEQDGQRYVAHVLAQAATGRAAARRVAQDLRGILESDLPASAVARAGLSLLGWLGRESPEVRPEDVQRIRAAAEASGDLALRADAVLLQCSSELTRGRWRREAFDEAVALARLTADPDRIGWALGHLGTLHRLDGDAAEAVRRLHEAVTVAGDHGPPDRRVTLLTELGLAQRAMFDLPGAIASLDAALPYAARAADPFVEQALMHRLGGTLLYFGRVDPARLWLARALDVAERAGMATPCFEIRGSLAYLELERGDLAAAEAGMRGCLAELRLGKVFHQVVLHAQYALLAAEKGDLLSAASFASTALTWAERRPGAPPQSLAQLADGVWRAFADDPGAGAAFTRAYEADPAGDQASFALGYRVLVSDDGQEDLRELSRRSATTGFPALRAFVDAVTGRADDPGWLHARLAAKLRAARARQGAR